MRLLAAFVLVVVSMTGAAWWGASFLFDRPGPLTRATAVVVPPGSTRAVSIALSRAGVLDDPTGFEIAAFATRRNGPIHAAEFAFPAQASLRAVLVILRTARPVEHRITIAEGLTAAEIASALAGADAAKGPTTVPAEGSVLPQTYDYERGTGRAVLLGRMQAAMRTTLAGIWAGRDPAAGLGSPRALLVLASIVERETAIAAERPLVAGVFLNRLRLGMKLQSDPTVAYQATGGLGSLERALTRLDLGTPGPTNTYLLQGLPLAPICAPGVASLLAVAHPARTDALYFVANGKGGHLFATSLAEHERNVMYYRAGGSAPGPARN